MKADEPIFFDLRCEKQFYYLEFAVNFFPVATQGSLYIVAIHSAITQSPSRIRYQLLYHTYRQPQQFAEPFQALNDSGNPYPNSIQCGKVTGEKCCLQTDISKKHICEVCKNQGISTYRYIMCHLKIQTYWDLS